MDNRIDHELFQSATASRLLNDAISQDQIALCREQTNVGDEITFTDSDGNSINGAVIAKFPHIFFMDNGHNYTWIQYLIGNPFLKHRLKKELDRISERRLYDKQDRLYIRAPFMLIGDIVATSSHRKNGNYSGRSKSYYRTNLSLDDLDRLRKVMRGI